MESIYRMSVGLIYFFQMAALTIFYRKTGDNGILYEPGRETRLLMTIRSAWVFAVIASICLYVVFPLSLKWGELHLGDTVRVSGIIVGIASDALILWILASLGRNISAGLKVRDSHRLVTDGPYRYVRHPLYSAGIPLFLAISLISSNWIPGFVGIGFQLFIMIVRTPSEEKMMIEHFGDEYRSYIRKTGAFFPRIRTF